MTLSRDRTLRVWPISEQLSSSLGAFPMETEGQHEEASTMDASISSQPEIETTFTNMEVENGL